jgi:hypothetical protein
VSSLVFSPSDVAAVTAGLAVLMLLGAMTAQSAASMRAYGPLPQRWPNLEARPAGESQPQGH